MTSFPVSRIIRACADLTAQGPADTVEQFVAEGHARMAAVLESRSGFCVIAARSRPVEGDPLLGWRVQLFYAVGASDDEIIPAAQDVQEETYVDDPVVQRLVRDAGRHRTYHDPDPRTDPDRRGTIDERYWELLRLVDRLKLVYALGSDVEIHLGFDRFVGESRFSTTERDLLWSLLSGIGPWMERLALLHGYLEGQAPLSPRERQIALGLLGDAPLKHIAGRLGMSEARARELVRAVYRKLGVGSRAELAFLWARRTTEGPDSAREATCIPPLRSGRRFRATKSG